MKYLIVASALLIASLPSFGQELSNQTDSISYALGVDLGRNLSQLDMGLSSELIYQGMKDLLEGEGNKLTEAEVQTLLKQLQAEVNASQQRKQQAIAQEAIAKGEAFLAQNKTKEGIQTTESGLQYEVLEQGEGAKPIATSNVKVHYEGTLLDGKVFDSSYKRGQPAEFPLNRVIPGWTEGVQLMSVGSKYRFFVPSNLAYGPNGAPPNIGPHETLIFVVELLEIVE